MKRWDLKIVLKSDLCTATGENTPGLINTKTALEYGIPFIPAKRLKGCLVEAGRELADNGVIERDVLGHLFGAPGLGNTNGVYVKDAHLYSAPKHLFGLCEEGDVIIDDYEKFREDVGQCPEVDEVFLEEVFTRKRSRTAIDARWGSAQEHSLRTMQTVPAGIVLNARLEGELNEQDEAALELCVKGLRHIGLEISRGLGEVRCSLEKVDSGDGCYILPGQSVQSGGFEGFSLEEEIELPFEIRLDSPVVVEGGSGSHADCLPGAAVLGALAGMYIRKYSLGTNAHEDEDFRRIFLKDGVQFGYGFLKAGEDHYIPCPKALAAKKDDRERWFNIWCADGNTRRKDINDQVYFKGKELHVAVPNTEIHFHHARPADRGIAHPLNDRAENTVRPTGQFFEYIALSKGQIFAGTWRGMAKDIIKLTECLADNGWHLRLGRSRTAEYGECTFQAGEPRKLGNEKKALAKEWLVWLLTPMILENNHPFIERETIEKQMREIVGDWEKMQGVCAYTVFHGYNSRWRMPSVSYPALASGSAFRLTFDRNKEINISEAEGKRWGMLTGKGCGQIMLMPMQEADMGVIVQDSCKKQTMEPMGCEKQRNIHAYEGMLAQILSYYKEKKECESLSMEKLGEIPKENLPPSSAIALLLQILRSQNGKNSFYETLESQAEKISRQNKRKRVLELIEPCRGESYEFTKLYLENAKWKARCREKNEE